MVCHSNAVLDKDAREVLVLALTRLEGPVLRIIWRIVLAPNAIIYVLAEVSGVGAGWVTGFETERTAPDEAGYYVFRASKGHDIGKETYLCHSITCSKLFLSVPNAFE